MKRVVLCLLFLLLSLSLFSAELLYYVNTDSDGDGDGTTNATTGANCAFDNLFDFEALNLQLATSGDYAKVLCSAPSGTADTTGTTFAGWTTAETEYILIAALSGQEALKTAWDATRYRLEVTDVNCLTISEDYVRVENLQIRAAFSAAGGKYAINIVTIAAPSDIRVTGCRLDGDSKQQYGGIVSADADTTLLVANNIIENFLNNGVRIDNGTNLIYNNILYNLGGYGIRDGGGTLAIKNNAIWTTGNDIRGNGTCTVQYNAADDDLDTEFTETTNIIPTNWANEFAPSNFTLLSGGDCEGAGVGPGTDANVPTPDIDGTTRSGATCDIGADEYEAAGGSIVPIVATTSRRRLMTSGMIWFILSILAYGVIRLFNKI